MAKRILKISAAICLVSFTAAYFFWKTSDLSKKPTNLTWISVGTSLSENDVSTGSPTFDKNLDLSKIKSIEIETGTINVELKAAKAADGHMLLNANPLKFSSDDVFLDYEGERLKIRIAEKPTSELIFIGKKIRPGGLTLNIPANVNRISVKTVSGHLSIEDLNLEKLTTKTTSGDVELKAATTNELDSESVSGDFELEGDLKNLTLKTVSAEIELKIKNSAPNININTVSGETKIEFIKSADVQINFSTVSGSFETEKKSDVPESHNGNNFNKTYGKGTGIIHVKSVSGNLKFK